MPPSREARRPSVEVMVLAYKSKAYVAPCLRSLQAQTWPDLKVTVLDNASGDGTAEYVRATFPGFEVIASERNLGFAAGHNLLFRRSTADYVVLLNHDAEARPDFVERLVAAAEAMPAGAVFGAKMLMRRCPTILNSTGIVMNEGGFAVDRDIGRKDRGTASEPERIFAACGGAMLIRGAVLRELGGFDPTYFMYVEDVDLCWRARLAGHEVYYVPTAVVVHDWHGDLAKGDAVAAEGEAIVAAREGHRRFQVERNRLQTVVKNWAGGNLLRVLRGIRRYDRGRLRALREHVTRGGGPLPASVLAAVRRAHRWCWLHAVGLWRRRRQAQRQRRVGDAAFQDLIQPGFHEPSGVGDLHAIVDRHCATPGSDLRMGPDDRGCLGPGWHHPEPREDRPGHVRWSMAEAWLYLRAASAATRLHLELLPPPRPTWVEVAIDGAVVGKETLAPGEARTVSFALSPVAPGAILEVALRCGAFCPLHEGLGNDARELGLRLTRAWVE